jgi:signal transduction histidine kinase
MGTITVSGLRRKQDGRLLAGVCSGVGDRIGLDPAAVRLAFVLLTAAGGAGIVLYAALWLLLPPDTPNGPAGVLASARAGMSQLAAYGALAIALLLIVWIAGAGIAVWPVVAAALGVVILWQQLVGDKRVRWAPARPHGAALRAAFGAVLVVGGIAGFYLTHGELAQARQGLAAATAIVVGFAVIGVPWLMRLVTERDAERRERIRADEHSELAAQLHDSMLHTLTLIQRNAHDSGQVQRLALAQERQLRAWLDRPDVDEQAALCGQLTAVAGEVEDIHGMPIEVVCLGDCQLSEPMATALQAAREAMINAAKHSGARQVSVFAEVEPVQVTIFVRDRGKGFSLSEIPSGRLGIQESIVGRMARAGAVASIRSAPGEGTEVELQVAR